MSSGAPTPADGRPNSGEIAQAQLDWVRANPAAGRLLAPMYLLPHDPVSGTTQRDGVHLSPEGYNLLGEYQFKAQLAEDDTGVRWAALGEHVTIDRSGTTITISYFRDAAKTRPWTGLSFDTSAFTRAAHRTTGVVLATGDPVPGGARGFVHTAGITRVALGTSQATAALGLANDRVVITLGSAASGELSYAYHGAGSRVHADAWGNLVDSDPTPSYWFPGLRLRNPAVAFKALVE